MRVSKKEFGILGEYLSRKGIDAILIGDLIRKRLFKKHFREHLLDRKEGEHLDLLLRSNYSVKKTKKIFREFLKEFGFKLNFNKISYSGKVNKKSFEIIGFLINKKVYYSNWKVIEVRPDISIERIGKSYNGESYDEYGSGYSDFKRKIIRVNPSYNLGTIPLKKALKIIQVKFQTNFNFEKRTKVLILNSLEDKKCSEIDFLIDLINKRSKNNFDSLEDIKSSILQETI